MPGSMKNRDLHPIGTRVKLAFNKLSTRVGTVTEYTEDGERMYVHWDDDFITETMPRILGPYMKLELKKATERNDFVCSYPECECEEICLVTGRKVK